MGLKLLKFIFESPSFVEFAAERFGTRLVVVLGHSGCGAILATLEELARPASVQSRNLRSIVDRVRPSVEALLATELRNDTEALLRQAVRANVRASVDHLRHGSAILEQQIERDGLLVDSGPSTRSRRERSNSSTARRVRAARTAADPLGAA